MPMPCRRDIVYPDGTYHVYARGNNRMGLFRDESDYRFYLDTLSCFRTKFGIIVYHFALMPNHVHLVLRLVGEALSGFMHRVQMAFAKKYCRKYGFVGHVWQGRYKTRTIDTDSYLFACGNYIEMNPVRAGLVADPAHWPHSSYRVYALGERNDLVTVDPLYENLGTTPEARRAAYRRNATRSEWVPEYRLTQTGILVPS